MTPLEPAEVQVLLDRLGIPARFSDSETARLATTNVVERRGFFAFPTPEDNVHLSVLGLRRLLGVDPDRPPAFFDHPWYLDESFGHLPCEPGWHVVGMDILPASAGRPIYYAEDIKREGFYLPSAAEVLLMLFLHFAATGERLLMRKHTWTRDRTSTKRFVSIGAFGRAGVFVSSHEVGYESRGLGICPIVEPRGNGGEG